MDEFDLAVFSFKKIKPKFGDKLWLDTNSLLTKIKKKSGQFKEKDKKYFVYLVGELFKRDG